MQALIADSLLIDHSRRRLLLAAGAAAGLPLVSLTAQAADPDKLRIGFQKSSTLMILLKSRGTLEKALAPLQVSVQWHEFTSGLPLLEALNIGALDGRAAFESGNVAAWVIWDPFLAAVQRQASARVLVDGNGLSSYRRFYLAATPFAQRRADVVATVYAELQRAGAWVKANPAPAADWHAPLIGLDAPTVQAANQRRSYAVQPVDADALSEQQRIADAFTQAQIIPRKVSVAESPVWKPAA